MDQSMDAAAETSLAERVRPMLDEVRARSRQAEAIRGPIGENMDLLKRVGLIRAMVPRRYGGLEAGIADWMQALRLLASADMSTAWLGGLCGAHGFVVTKFQAEVQEEIWGRLGPDALVSSATALFDDGIADRVDGGIRVSGRWKFSSGVAAADWTMVFLKIKSSGGGEPQFYWALLPKSDYVIEDTWFTAGMRGTGSCDLILSNTFVPEHRIGGPGMPVEEPGRTRYDNPLFDVPFRVMFPILFAPVVLGGAEGAIELFRQMLLKRKAAISGIPLSESSIQHVRIAEAVVRMRSVARLLESNWQELDQRIETRQPVTSDDQMNWRTDQSFAGREAVRIVEQLVEAAGSSIYFDTNPLQRFWRDLHVAGGHSRFDTDTTLQAFGRHLLGLPPDPRWV